MGDVITEVAGKAVKTEEDVKTAMATLSGSEDYVKLTLLKGALSSSPLKTSTDDSSPSSSSPSSSLFPAASESNTFGQRPLSFSFGTPTRGSSAPAAPAAPAAFGFSNAAFGATVSPAASPLVAPAGFVYQSTRPPNPFSIPAAPATLASPGLPTFSFSVAPSVDSRPVQTSISFGGGIGGPSIGTPGIGGPGIGGLASRVPEQNRTPTFSVGGVVSPFPSPATAASTTALGSPGLSGFASPPPFTFASPSSLSFVSQTVRDQSSSSFKVPSFKDIATRTDKDQKRKSTNVKKKAAPAFSTSEKAPFKRSISVLDSTLLDRKSLEFYRLSSNQRLFMATQRSDLADIVTLLEEGADLDSVKEGSIKQETAWRSAVATGDPSLLKVLLRYIPTYKLNSPVSYVEGRTPLMIFASSGSLECIRYTYLLYQYKHLQLSL